VQNTLICSKFMPVACDQQQGKAYGKEKPLVKESATFILIQSISQYVSNRLLITLLFLENSDPFKLPQSRIF